MQDLGVVQGGNRILSSPVQSRALTPNRGYCRRRLRRVRRPGPRDSTICNGLAGPQGARTRDRTPRRVERHRIATAQYGRGSRAVKRPTRASAAKPTFADFDRPKPRPAVATGKHTGLCRAGGTRLHAAVLQGIASRDAANAPAQRAAGSHGTSMPRPPRRDSSAARTARRASPGPLALIGCAGRQPAVAPAS